MKVGIATPFYYTEWRHISSYIGSLTATVESLVRAGVEYDLLVLSGDTFVARARNSLVAHFLQNTQCTDLFFIDSDLAWQPDDFVRVLFSEPEIVAGAYPVKNRWDTFSCIPETPERAKDGLIAAKSLSTGFMRIKRSALEALWQFGQPYLPINTGVSVLECRAIFETEIVAGQWAGEDSTFCRRWRDLGRELWIMPGIELIHCGVRGVYGRKEEAPDRARQESAGATEGVLRAGAASATKNMGVQKRRGRNLRRTAARGLVR